MLWKTYFTLLLKKCLRPCPGRSMYLSERINWIISIFPLWISKILFALGSLNHFGSLGCRIGECLFFYVSILFLGSVHCNCNQSPSNWFPGLNQGCSRATNWTFFGHRQNQFDNLFSTGFTKSVQLGGIYFTTSWNLFKPKNFWTQLKSVQLRGPFSLRLLSLRQYCT